MFVSVEVRLRIKMPTAQARLAGLVHDGSLRSASAVAYARGDGPASVGSPGSGAARLVDVRVLDLVRLDGSAGLAVRWEAMGPDSELFPALDADVTLTQSDVGDAVLALKGVYRPARGAIAAQKDDTGMRGIASSTVREFINTVAAYLTGCAGHC
jgi:hypothetical protein